MRGMFSVPGFQSHSREARVYVYNLLDGLICHYFSGVCCDYFRYTRMKCVQIFVFVFRYILSFQLCYWSRDKEIQWNLSVCVVNKTSKDKRYKNSVITLTAETHHVSHHSDVTSAPWRLESPITQLIVEQLFSPITKKYHSFAWLGPLWGETFSALLAICLVSLYTLMLLLLRRTTSWFPQCQWSNIEEYGYMWHMAPNEPML